MTFTTMLITNVVLAAALIAGLAYAMSRAAKLTPHRPGAGANSRRIRRPLRRGAHAPARSARAPSRQLDPALERL